MLKWLLLCICSFGALKAAEYNPVSFSFYIVPRHIQSNGYLKVRAFLAPAYNLPNAEILASLIKGKTHFSYSSALRKFMLALGIKKCEFKLLERHLKKRLRCAQKDPQIFVDLLSTFTQTGIAPTFTLTFHLPGQV